MALTWISFLFSFFLLLIFYYFVFVYKRDDGFESVSDAVGCDVIPFGCPGTPEAKQQLHQVNFVEVQQQ